jgi:NitT/TauT family transport system ATP-binding protein
MAEKTSEDPAAGGGATPASREVAVSVQAVEKVFPNGTRALAPIDLTVHKGEFVSLIGPSGCGKSTLLKLIANFYPPSQGRLSWWQGGFDQVGQPERRLAFVFQEPTLMPWARVDANVRLALDLERQDGDPDEKVAAALGQVGLSNFARS